MNARRPIYRSARSNRGRIAASRFRPATAGKEAAFDLLLAPLGPEPSVSAECLFADPIGDIALTAKNCLIYGRPMIVWSRAPTP